MEKLKLYYTNSVINAYKDEQDIQPLLPSEVQVEDDNSKIVREVDDQGIKPLLPFSFEREEDDKKGGE